MAESDRVAAISEIISKAVAAHKAGLSINLADIKLSVARRYYIPSMPKTVEIIAAIPEQHRKTLVPLLKAKPVRSASGIAVVAVMCKPHRCPHITMTGNICVYCLALDMQVLTSRGFLFRDELFAALEEDQGLLVAGYDSARKQLVYERPTGRVNNAPTGFAYEFSAAGDSRRWDDTLNGVSLRVSGEHDMFVKRGAHFVKVRASALAAGTEGDAITFLARAQGGARVGEAAYPFLERLGLALRQKNAFLELYGFWLGNGAVANVRERIADLHAEWKEVVALFGHKQQFTSWVWTLPSHDVSCILRGVSEAAGGKDAICTSALQFRDALVHLCLRAGYSATFALHTTGSTDACGQPTLAIYRVSWSDAKQLAEPSLSVSRDTVRRVAYSGETWCLTMPSGFLVTRRAHADAQGCVTQASRPIVVGNCPGGPDSDFEYSTQSYTGYEPTSMRAIRARYNPYLQTRNRVDQLQRLGHSTDKVEFIIMGGTFMSLPSDYRDYFVRNLHDALSGHSSSDVDEAVRYSEESTSRCIGITIETRPDYCLEVHLSDLLRYGCTRLEIGVQSIYEDIARDTNRGHTVAAVCDSFEMSKDCGYKIVAHMMPDLPNSNFERDMEGFREFFENPMFRTDGLKIYPTLVIRGTGLYELWRTGAYKNLHPDELVDLVAKILALVPPWTRVYRIQRDIPMPLVTSGVEYGNLRQLALRRNAELGLKCRDVRTREVGIKNIHHNIVPERVELIRRDYTANGGWETFLSYEDPHQDILIALLRLRKCAARTFRPELLSERGSVSIVRELHVYGTAIPVHTRNPRKWQHQGYGTMLMEEAERVAREEHGSVRIAVISGVGVRNYYRRLGYYLDGPYMVKDLVDEE